MQLPLHSWWWPTCLGIKTLDGPSRRYTIHVRVSLKNTQSSSQPQGLHQTMGIMLLHYFPAGSQLSPLAPLTQLAMTFTFVLLSGESDIPRDRGPSPA